MKKLLLLFIAPLVLFSCSKDDEQVSEDSLTTYSQPNLHLGDSEEAVIADLGEPDLTFSADNVRVKWTFMSDTPGWQSIVYNFISGEVNSTEVNFTGSEENLSFLKTHLENLYGSPGEPWENGGLIGLRYPVRYPLTDLHYSEDADVIFIDYSDIENPNVTE